MELCGEMQTTGAPAKFDVAMPMACAPHFLKQSKTSEISNYGLRGAIKSRPYM